MEARVKTICNNSTKIADFLPLFTVKNLTELLALRNLPKSEIKDEIIRRLNAWEEESGLVLKWYSQWEPYSDCYGIKMPKL